MRSFAFLKSYTRLPKSIYILFIAFIINSVGSFVYPFLAIFLTLKLGMDETAAGLLVTLVIAAEGPGRLLGGKLADTFGRKKIIVVLNIIGAIAYLVCAFLKQSMIIPYIIIFANFIRSGEHTAINAMVADLTTKKNRSDAFSLLYLGFNIGFAIGPLLAGFLIINYISLIFLIDGITTVLATIPILIFIKDTLPSKKKATSLSISEDEKPEVGNTLKIFLKKPLLVGLALISVIYSFIYAQINFSLPLYLNEIFSQNGPKIYGMLMSVNAIVVVVTTLFIIAFFRRFRPTINIAFAGILFAIGFGLLYFSQYLYLFIISALIWTFGEIVNAVSSNVLIANYSPMSHRGRFNAIITFIGGIGFSISPLLIGIFISYYDIQSVWLLMAILAILGALLMFAFYFFIARKIKTKSNA